MLDDNNLFTIYLNNFREFKKTFIDIKPVNFFVGENSTGKTSIMYALKILTSDNFVPFPIALDEHPLFIDGLPFELFSDIANKEEALEIGIIIDDNVVLSSYKRDKDSAKLVHISFSYYQNLVSIDCVQWSVKIHQKTKKDFNDNAKIFKYLSDVTKKKSGYKKFSEDKLVQENYSEYINTTFNLTNIVFRLRNNPKLKDSSDKRDDYASSIDIFNFRNYFRYKQVWIDPIRAEPERVYLVNKKFSRKYAIPNKLKELEINKTGEKVKIEINKFGKSSTLFDQIIIKPFSEEQNSPYVINIAKENTSYSIDSVGYGVSQILPIVTELAIENEDKSIFFIQQPEVHLHPKAQAYFGEYLFSKSRDISDGIFVIETHSDFVIDRFRLMQKRSIAKVNAQILFFEKNKKGHNTVTSLSIDDNGRYPDDQPENFRGFFINEMMELLEL